MKAPAASGIGMTSARTRDRLVERLRAGGIRNEAVLERIGQIPRHLFVDEALASRAYEDTALPLGHGQTISQPFVVALMTQSLIDARPGAPKLRKVLEIGTGCGYQTAVLAPFVQHVYSIERIRSLAARARRILREQGISNVSVRHSDGMHGWPSQAPFDGMLVTAAPEDLPEALAAQLGDGGRMIIPVGNSAGQSLLMIERRGAKLIRKEIHPVSFVPLRHGTEI
jgi:protein-L-isoaspartate(D-aspartate) O-methyltransferase